MSEATRPSTRERAAATEALVVLRRVEALPRGEGERVRRVGRRAAPCAEGITAPDLDRHTGEPPAALHADHPES
jgi:hypothetical protein